MEKPWRNQTENHLTVTIQTAKPRKNQRRSPRWTGAPDGAGQTEEITLDDIKEGDVVAITLDDDGNAATITVQSMDMGGGQGGPGGQASGVDSYDTVNEYSSDETVSDTSLESTGTDENAALISNGAEFTFSNDAISRTSSDSQGGDNSSFYGDRSSSSSNRRNCICQR